MIDTYLQETYEKRFVVPLLRLLPKNPHLITVLALISGISIIPALYFEQNYIALTLLITTGFLDTVDGSLARHLNRTSPQGAVLDIVSDRLVEFSVVLGLYFVDPTRALSCLLMLGSILICVTSFLVVGIFSQQSGRKSFYYSPGIMERGEAFLFFALMILVPGWFVPLALIFTLLLFATALIRIVQFFRS